MSKSLNAEAMIKEAERSSGLSDWDGDEFRTPFKILIESAENESNLSDIGRTRLKTWLMLRLVQRLKMVEDRKQRPEIVEQQIIQPVFLFGFPRAGTTFLHTLLGIDPDNISPAYWQLNLPSPPPNDPNIDHTDSIRKMQENLEFQGWTDPDIAAMHFHSAELPEEDFLAFEYSFVSTGFMGFVDVPSYVQKVVSGDFSEAYKWHKKFLQVLQIGAEGRRWMLKAPEHSLHVETLVNEYPDALLVQHHRDPSKVMASVFSVLTGLRSKYCNGVQTIGPDEARAFMKMYAVGITEAAKLRTSKGLADRFVDIQYLDLVRNPVACVRKIYDKAEIKFDDTTEDRVNNWVADNRQGKHGKHRYMLSEYGLTQAEVHEVFADYINLFNVELEGKA